MGDAVPTVSRTITLARRRASATTARRVLTELDARAVLDHGCFYDPSAVTRVCAFFERYLRHTDGEWAGQPFTLMRWQRQEVIAPLFGWKRKDGSRRYRRGGIWLPKKNGKSTLSAGLSLYMLRADGEAGANVFNAANDRGQAGIVFDVAKHILLSGRECRCAECRRGRKCQAAKFSVPFEIIDSRKTITFKNCKYQALSCDVPTKEGLNIHLLIADEIHSWEDRELWSTLAYGGAARRQPLILSISTAGVHVIGSIGLEQYQYAARVRDGNSEDWSFFSLIYETTAEDAWDDPRVWKRVNPSYGVTVRPEALADECREAKESPAKENDFRRYRLNQWVQQSHRALPMHVWDGNHAHEVREADLRGRRCWGGLDLSSVSDMTALVWVFPCADGEGAYDVLARFWLPEEALVTSRNRGLYQQWQRAGYLAVTPGNAIDMRHVEARVLEDFAAFDVQRLAIDRLFQGQSVYANLADELGDPSDGTGRLVAHGQGYVGMAAPTHTFMRLAISRVIHHGGHPVLRWMADNLVLMAGPAGIEKPDKDKSNDKIDGIVALIMALGMADSSREYTGDFIRVMG